MIVLDQPTQIDAYRALVVAKGLEFWAKHKMRLNRAYTPSNLMAAASQITGKKYRARDYLVAAADIREMLK